MLGVFINALGTAVTEGDISNIEGCGVDSDVTDSAISLLVSVISVELHTDSVQVFVFKSGKILNR